MGYCVAGAGDVNGDGYSDIIVGAPYYDNGETDEGQVYVYHGSSGDLSSSADWTAESNQASAQFGHSVSTAGDVNGDGYSDVIVGAPYYDNSETDEGRAYLYYGNGGPGKRCQARQLRADEIHLIGPCGIASESRENRDFVVRLFARSSQGRSRAKLQVQCARVGQMLKNGILFNQSGYTDTGISGMDLNFTVSGLDAMQAYQWQVRVMYDPSQGYGGQLHGPWYRMCWGRLSGNADFRTGPATLATATAIPTIVPTSTPIPKLKDFQGRLIDKKYFFVYPNPTRSVNVKFRFFLQQPAEVTVKIYTPSGQYVWQKKGYYNAGWNEFVWNSSGIANGVYLYIGKASNGQIQERIIKKLVLVK